LDAEDALSGSSKRYGLAPRQIVTRCDYGAKPHTREIRRYAAIT